MRQYVLCNGCGNQLPVPDSAENEPNSNFLQCEKCGHEFSWDATESDVRLLNLEDAASNPSPEPAFQLELESNDSENDLSPIPLEEQAAIEPNAPDWSVLKAASTRRRPKESSTLRKILPPVLGGLAAFPIATIILWYGFGRDIGSAGPTVARYVPWIVPEKLRDLPFAYARRESASNNAVPRRLPSIDKGKSDDNISENAVISEKTTQSQRLEQPSDPFVAGNEKVVEPTQSAEPSVGSGPPISETIARLRLLQKNWDSTPKEQQAMVNMVGQYCSEIKQLSKASAELKGRSAAVWRKELDALSRVILSHPNITTVIQFSAVGQWPGVPPALPNDFVATVVNVGEENQPNSTETWTLQEKWRYGTSDVSIEALPDAWPAVSVPIKGNCIILGRLIDREESAGSSPDQDTAKLILRVHAVLLP